VTWGVTLLVTHDAATRQAAVSVAGPSRHRRAAVGVVEVSRRCAAVSQALRAVGRATTVVAAGGTQVVIVAVTRVGRVVAGHQAVSRVAVRPRTTADLGRCLLTVAAC